MALSTRSLISFFNKICIKFPVLLFDVSAIPVAWILSYWLRYNLQPFDLLIPSTDLCSTVAILMIIQTSSYYYFNVYRGLWRFASIYDVIRIIQSVLMTAVIVVPIFYLISLLSFVPRSVFPLYGIILTTLLCGARFLRRYYWEQSFDKYKTHQRQRVLIIGAGQAGGSLVRELRRTQQYDPIGFIDDNLEKKGLDIHGVQVLGHLDALPRLVLEHNIHLICIAIPSASSQIMRHIVEKCVQCHIPFRTLPSVQALVSGQIEVSALREVHIEDLLGRDQVELQWDQIASELLGKRILVTGGGGSIGSELCRQVLKYKPSQLIILDNHEFNLYQIDLELKQKSQYSTIELVLASVTDRTAVHEAMRQFKPEIVFHAAAFKHVPLLENQIRAAVQNNIFGTRVMAEESVAASVEKFILISTDKAVNPTNVMGATKRVAEIYCQNLNATVRTQFITVRFGNVLGSVGSVVPLFKEQIKKGGPVTVTHPDIERYFMTIPEASQLILQAMVNGRGGEIFVLDMGKPVNITELAHQMIRLSGQEPGRDIHIVYTGLRPGEKLFEELFHHSEQWIETEHEKLFKARVRFIDWHQLMEAFSLLESYCASNQQDELRLLLKNIVPEYQCGLVFSHGTFEPALNL